MGTLTSPKLIAPDQIARAIQALYSEHAGSASRERGLAVTLTIRGRAPFNPQSEPSTLPAAPRRARPRCPPLPDRDRRPERRRRLLPGDVASGAAGIPAAPERVEPPQLDPDDRAPEGDRSRPRAEATGDPGRGSARRAAAASANGQRSTGRLGQGRRAAAQAAHRARAAVPDRRRLSRDL